MKPEYSIADSFVYRRHLLPTDTLDSIINGGDISLDTLVKFCLKQEIFEPIFIASQELALQIVKYNEGTLKDKKKQDKLKESMLKYVSRMSSRCTPFGLFAGCCTGSFTDNTKVQMSEISDFIKHTRLDMHYLINIADYIQKDKSIRSQLKFYPNSSLYTVDDKYRYVEYKYNKGNRKHFIVEVESNEYLDAIIQDAKQGKTINQLTDVLTKDGYTIEESTEYIEEIIDNQVLISELEPSVTGSEFIDHIKKKLTELDNSGEILSVISDIDNKINSINTSEIGLDTSNYNDVTDKLKSLELPFNPKYIYQTDLNIASNSCELSKDIKKDLLEGLSILNRITPKREETQLDSFKNSFYSRYEEREMPLLQVLDTDLGIGFKQNGKSSGNDINPLVDDLFISPGKQNGYKTNINKLYSILHKKIVEAAKTDSREIELTDKDLEGFEADNSDMPLSMSAMTEVYKTDNGIEISLKSVGGSSGANLLGRFAQSNDDIKEHVKNITLKEQEKAGDKILAEIVHVPESRVGNILQRPELRDYEIPYLGRTAVDPDNAIYPDDLMISVRYGKYITLRSKRLNKIISPRLSTAHNYSNNALPLYEFLCNMQTDGLKSGLFFHWGDIENQFDFLPRVRYKNIIFEHAQWRVKSDEVKHIFDIKDEQKMLEEMNALREKRGIPAKVLLVEGDNELYLDLSIAAYIKLLKAASKRGIFVLKDFYYTPDKALETKDDKHYRNQFVFTFEKEVQK